MAKYRCYICTQTYVSPESLKAHLRDMHGVTTLGSTT